MENMNWGDEIRPPENYSSCVDKISRFSWQLKRKNYIQILFYRAQNALKYFISLVLLALTLNWVLKFEKSGKLLQPSVDNKVFGGELGLAVVEKVINKFWQTFC